MSESTVKEYTIVVLAGDGIGPAVMDEALAVIDAVTPRFSQVRLTLKPCAAGAGEFLRSGSALPDETLSACRVHDAVLLGAMGLPNVRWPGGRELTPQIDLREQLDLYCGLRPIRLYHADDSPLKGRQAGDIDFVIVRESTEGLFSSRLSDASPGADESRDVMQITRRGSARIFRSAFELARQRRRHVTLVDKANVLPSMVFFRSVFDEIAAEFPDVTTERIYVDAAALFLIRRPESFDVIVTENMFGDILSDLAAALVGGMGMAPSADIGQECAVFQPSHGSAPDIADQGIANPAAMVLSAAMLLDWLGHAETKAAAESIQSAVSAVFSDPEARTRDMGGVLTTRAMGQLIREHIS